MCGVLGYICNRRNGFNQNEIKAVHDLMYITSLRGTDSTGLFYVNNSGDIQIHKETGESSKFLKTKEWEATDRELFRSGQLIVGHCRAKTRGDNTDQNAHPFVVDNKIVLVHNGSMYGDHKQLANTEVDSHAIAHVLAEEPDIEKALTRINAAYALVWYNNETRTLHAIRNKDRPLWFAAMEDGSMLFSSEQAFIYTTAWRNGLKIQKGYPEMLEEHRLFTFYMDDLNKEYEYRDLNCKYVYIPPPKKEEPKEEHKSGQTFHDRRQALALPINSSGRPKSLVEIAEEGGLCQRVVSNPGNQAWREHAKPNTRVMVEATDYKLINEAAKLYYIYGEIISPDTEINGFGCGWEIICNSEEEVVQYVTREFFSGQVEYGMQRGIDLRPGDRVTSLFKLINVNAVPVDAVMQ
jgi:predicted glutamine amidotransferase